MGRQFWRRRASEGEQIDTRPAKIHVRETAGFYTSWRWAAVAATQLVFLGLPWLNWRDQQWVLIEQWPRDFAYLTAFLLIVVLTSILLSALVSRIWCGFMCPHTVYTELFMWIERRIEGGRSARLRLDQEPLSTRKIRKKVLKHTAWVLLAFWIGFTLVGYFTPIRLLLHELTAAALRPVELFWMACYGLLAYGNAGWLREKVCRAVCPHLPLQRAMEDQDTLAIRYDAVRGEPRGLRNRKSLAKIGADQTSRLGDCIDCSLCVQVCPTGRDIRQGVHDHCMGCAACADACNLVMDKIGAARGLIRYSTPAAPLNVTRYSDAVPSTANGG